jgi:hypothetical protein
MVMTQSSKHSPQVNDSESILSDIPLDKMDQFVDQMLKAIPPKPRLDSVQSPPLQAKPKQDVETEAEGKRYGELRRLKALRMSEALRGQTRD